VPVKAQVDGQVASIGLQEGRPVRQQQQALPLAPSHAAGSEIRVPVGKVRDR
jgi:hypothetical protein